MDGVFVEVSTATLRDLERSALRLVRLTVDMGGAPIPEDLWPVAAAKRGGRPPAPAQRAHLRGAVRGGAVVKRAERDERGQWSSVNDHPSWEHTPWPGDAKTVD